MIPQIYIGFISFFSSLTISYSITIKYLKYTIDNEIENEIEKLKKNLNDIKFNIITPISNKS